MANHLSDEKSPYLQQHRDNPVDWRPWGPEAFALARAGDRPVFLSIGYSTCHWCHVMAHESFEDGEVARALNRDYVPVKVDREERPDVDGVYMAACTAMTGAGGWPLTLLLTPDQKPFWAGTYLPRDGLLRLLEQAARLWREDRSALLETGERLTARLRDAGEVHPGKPSWDLLRLGAELYERSYDRTWGGFGEAPKFPSPHNLVFLLRYGAREGRRSCVRMAERTLEAMSRGGIFDHVGGGFSRYSTDRAWLAPHFEKMLYDNALLLWAYTEGYRRLGRPCFARTARETADYVLRELTAPEGGFCCGQDADSGGVEGKYYLFTPAELEALLGREDAGRFCRWYGITPGGNFEGGSIPNRIGGGGGAPEGLDGLRRRVYRYRGARNPLHRDDKVLTAWNGLMIAALARAGAVLGEPRFLSAARRACAFVSTRLTAAPGRLLARWREGEAAHPGKLDDYAFFLWGLLELYAASFDAALLGQAVQTAQVMLEEFFDPERGGFYPYAAGGEQLIARSKEAYDGAMPSGNSVAALVLIRLFRLTGEAQWRRAMELQLGYLTWAVREYPAGYGFALLAMLEALSPSAELVCVTAGEEPPQELLRYARANADAGLSILVKTAANAPLLDAAAPFSRSYALPGAGTRYYLCQGNTCHAPVERLEDLPGGFACGKKSSQADSSSRFSPPASR